MKLFSHSHNEAIGEIKKRNPWVEDVWNFPLGFYIVHWQNLKTPGHYSMRAWRHEWRLCHSWASWKLSLSYGRAPYMREQ